MESPASSRRVLAVAVVFVAAAGAGWWYASSPVLAPQPAPGAEPAAAPKAAARRTNIPRVARSKPAQSTDLPGLPVPAVPASGGAAGGTPTTEAAAAPDGPVDRRDDAPADAAATAVAIKAKMEEANEDIEDCLGAWMEVDPTLEGRVSMAFQLGPEGLTDAWVLDHSDVPFGPLSCFGAAIDSVDWAGVSSVPVEVTFPFVFTPGEEPEAVEPPG